MSLPAGENWEFNKNRRYKTFKVKGRRIFLHRHIAERALGKSLPAEAEVHHVDGNRKNNANSNLVVCENKTYHFLLHSRARTVQRGGDPNTEKLCAVCDSLVSRSGFRKRNNRADGIETVCKACTSRQHKLKAAIALVEGGGE